MEDVIELPKQCITLNNGAVVAAEDEGYRSHPKFTSIITANEIFKDMDSKIHYHSNQGAGENTGRAHQRANQ